MASGLVVYAAGLQSCLGAIDISFKIIVKTEDIRQWHEERGILPYIRFERF